MVEERPKYLGLGYGQSYGESSKAAMKAIETVQEGVSLQVFYLKSVKIVFRRNAIA
jgi:hypothetical protein